MERFEIAAAVQRERARLVADLVTVDDDAWDVPSLCTEWTVREVVAHLVRVGHFYSRPYTFERDLIRHGFRLNRALAQVAKRMATGRPPSELVAMLERSAYEQTLVFRFHPRPIFALCEWIVHGQDIRRPLGIPATFEPEHLIAAAETAQKWYTWGSRSRKLNVRLEATDAAWSVGSGPVYRGPLEAIAMVVFGRTAAMSDLLPHGA